MTTDTTPRRYPVEVHSCPAGGWTTWGRDADGRAVRRGWHHWYRDAQAFADRENRTAFPHLVVDPFDPAWDERPRRLDDDRDGLTMEDHLASESGEGKE